MTKANQKKYDQLKMPYGTACGRLRKQVLFGLLQKLGENTCFQCGKSIDSGDDLSIEHKKPWLDSDDPQGNFFNLENIAFSHLSCNSGAARQNLMTRRKPFPEHGSSTRYIRYGCRCDLCKAAYSKVRKHHYTNTGR